jgi:hypothetical protein
MSRRRLCGVPTAVAECVAEGECRPGTAQSENLPDFFKVDLKAKTIRAEDKGRLSPIKRIDRDADQITLYGSEAERSWILMIREKTGRMSASVRGDGESFVIFGVCSAVGRSRLRPALVRLGAQNGPQRRPFRAVPRRLPQQPDSLAERTEFELPVPISKLPDDSVVL